MERPHELLKPLNNQTERAIRIQLAAVCHLLEHFGWSDAILNHASARNPENPNHYIMNPFGLMYQEVTASNLVKIDFNGHALDADAWPVNKAGAVLHSAIYEARSEINCVIHTHTPYGVAVSILDCGLLCSDQMAMLFHNSVGYHDFEGIAVNADEKSRFAENLGKNKCLILRSHGLVATGRSVAEAFWNYYYLEFACRVQILALSTGKDIRIVSDKIKSHTFEQHEFFCHEKAPTAEAEFPGNFDVMLSALMRMLDRKGDSSYKE